MNRWIRSRFRARDALSTSIAFIAAAGLLAFGIGWLIGSGAATAGDSPGWTTYRDPDHGFTVQFPSAWHRATELLVPHSGEILSLGTGALEVGGGGDCNLYPAKALRAMGPGDILLVLRGRRVVRRWIRTWPRRPEHFRIRHRRQAAGWLDGDWMRPRRGSLSPSAGWTEFSFRDNGRAFTVLLAIGPSVSPTTRRSALSTLDSLRFQPRVR